MYSPQFTIMNRDGRKSLWVTMPGSESPWNIGDLDSIDDRTLGAIVHAFDLGMNAHDILLSKANNYYVSNKWKEE